MFTMGSDDQLYFCTDAHCDGRVYTTPVLRAGTVFDVYLGEAGGQVRLSEDANFTLRQDSATVWTFTRLANPAGAVYTVRIGFVAESTGPNPTATPTATPTVTPTPTTTPTVPPTTPVVSDTVARPTVGIRVTPASGSTADVYTATIIGMCPSGFAPTARVGTVTENYELPSSVYGGEYQDSTKRVVLVDQRVRNGVTTFRFKAAMPGVVRVYPFCGDKQVAVAPFTVNGMTYAALGDSYSSGEGASPSDFLPGTNGSNVGCHRSTTAWPRIIARNTAIGVGQQAFVACSGGAVAAFYTANARWMGQTEVETAQLNHVVPGTTKLVTFTIGGNDVGFEKVLSACVNGYGSEGKANCRNDAELNKVISDNLAALQNGISIIENRANDSRLLKKSLADVYVDVATRMAPGGRIVVGGYPRLFGDHPEDYRRFGNGRSCIVHPGFEVRYDDAQWINRIDADGNRVIQEQIVKARTRLATIRPDVRIDYADAWASFMGHSLCDHKDAWINGVQIGAAGPKRQSFHPNSDGQSKGYARAFRTALGLA